MPIRKGWRPSSFQIILLGFLAVILLGTAMLMLPLASPTREVAPLSDALFTATSALCVTGLVVRDTATGWSAFGKTVILVLIQIGGLGFRTLDDLRTHRHHVRRYSLQSKLILTTSATLVLLPALWFYRFELGALPGGERVLAALFQSVTTRTAGFNTADYAAMSEAGQMMTVLLMLVGGSPGSTAGGMKTTTLAVLALSAVSVFRRRTRESAFSRTIPNETLRAASAILAAYLTLFLGVSGMMSRIESLPLLTAMFETASAIGTVGLTLGITPSLGAASRLMLVFLMYFGRVGGLTLLYAALPYVTEALIGDSTRAEFLAALGFSVSTVISVYILGVLISAVLVRNYMSGALVSLLSVITFNFFFTEPKYTLLAYEQDYPVTFVVMFLVSILACSLAERLKSTARQFSRTSFRINNAIKYTQQGSRIVIAASKQGQSASVSVADDGPGIPAGERVFEMFYTGEKRSADSRRGAGMGLTLCRSIVQAHGGEITLRDNKPHGAVFAFSLPLSEVDLHE